MFLTTLELVFNAEYFLQSDSSSYSSSEEEMEVEQKQYQRLSHPPQHRHHQQHHQQQNQPLFQQQTYYHGPHHQHQYQHHFQLLPNHQKLIQSARVPMYRGMLNYFFELFFDYISTSFSSNYYLIKKN